VKYQHVHVIINPASGQDKPMLSTLNTVFQPEGIHWEVSITKAAGDAAQFARAAAQSGADVVAVYGGDGTVTEAAAGLAGTGVPLAILPGGTANAIAVVLGIPTALEPAVRLMVNADSITRTVDLGQAGDRHFLIGVGIGIPGEWAASADREAKDRLGMLAYALSSIRAVANATMVRYRVTVDGQTVEREGVTCVIANAGSFGIPGFNLAPTIDMGDGLLDVLVIRNANLPAIVSLAANVVRSDQSIAPFDHWQAREIEVVAEPDQPAQADGEVLDPGPVCARVLPGAVRFLTPAPAE
jgi:YegS/Rv2252/BmrU family lipid kinase